MHESPNSKGPLAGIRVIDLSRVLAGPYCGSVLADLGADVIRVEHPIQRDEVRTWAPVVDGMSAAFAAVNHSKRGVVIDLANAEGAGVFKKLIAGADVLIENFRPGTLERFGVGHDTLLGINLRLVHCAIRAFPAGTAGEKLPGYEASMQARTGMMSLTGEHDGEPVRCGVSVVDLGTGLASVIAVLSALRERDRTGRGQLVEPALLRTAANFINYQIAGYSLANVIPERYGSGHQLLAPYGNFHCADGAVLIAAGNDRLWAKLCEALALYDSAGNMPYPMLALRIANRDAVNGLVGAAVSARKRQDVLDVLIAAGIPCAPVNNIAEFMSDATLERAHVLDTLRLQDDKSVTLAGPLFAADFLPIHRREPPRLDQHTDEVLRELGYAEPEIQKLRGSRAVG